MGERYTQYRCTMQGILQLFTDIKDDLSPRHHTLMMQTPFKHLFKAILEQRLDPNRKKDQVLDDILESYNRQDDAFMFGEKVYKPTRMDVKLVFAIEDGTEDMGNIRRHGRNASQIGPHYFGDTGRLLVGTVKDKVREIVLREDAKSEEDTVKLICLVLMQTLLFPNNGAIITWSYFYYIDSIDRMRWFDWSGQILKYLYESLRGEWDHPTKVKGCTLFLMYWFSEHSKTAIEKFSRSNMVIAPAVEDVTDRTSCKWIPRVVKWKLTELESIVTKTQLYRFPDDEFNPEALVSTVQERVVIETLDAELCDAEMVATVEKLEATGVISSTKGKEKCQEYGIADDNEWCGPVVENTVTSIQQQDKAVVENKVRSMVVQNISGTQDMPKEIQGKQVAISKPKTTTHGISNMGTVLFKEPVPKWTHAVEKYERLDSSAEINELQLKVVELKRDKALMLVKQKAMEREKIKAMKAGEEHMAELTEVMDEMDNLKHTRSRLQKSLISAEARVTQLEANKKILEEYAKSLEGKVDKLERECQTKEISNEEEPRNVDLKMALELSFEERLLKMDKQQGELKDKMEELSSMIALFIGKVEDESQKVKSKAVKLSKKNAGSNKAEHSCMMNTVRESRIRKRNPRYDYPMESNMAKKGKNEKK